jgi:Holliday junction resolvase RusA-like endonuclease
MAETMAGHGYGRKWRAFVPIEPPMVTHNDLVAYAVMRRGEPHGRIRKSDRLKDYEDRFEAHVKSVAAEITDTLDGPLRETVKLCYSPGTKHMAGAPKMTKPDVDNVVKTLNDVLEHVGIIANDSRVCDLRVIKAYSEPAGIFIRIEELEDANG